MKNGQTKWVSSGLVRMTKGGNFQKPDITLNTSWVKEAWDLIPYEMIQCSFHKFGISNSVDVSEDDAIYKSENDVIYDSKDDAQQKWRA